MSIHELPCWHRPSRKPCTIWCIFSSFLPSSFWCWRSWPTSSWVVAFTFLAHLVQHAPHRFACSLASSSMLMGLRFYPDLPWWCIGSMPSPSCSLSPGTDVDLMDCVDLGSDSGTLHHLIDHLSLEGLRIMCPPFPCHFKFLGKKVGWTY